MENTRKKNATYLNRAEANKAIPDKKRYHIWDSELSGFGLRVSPGGGKSWIVKYRVGRLGRGAQVRWMTIGPFPVIAATDARAQAQVILASAIKGEDPASELIAKRNEMTTSQMISFYEEEGCYIQTGARQGEPMKDETKRYTLARLKNHVVPLLGKKRASDVNEGDIERFARDVEAGKTAKDYRKGRTRVIVKGGKGAAIKVISDLSAVYSFAMRHKIVGSNPVLLAKVRKTANVSERFLDLDEVSAIGTAIKVVEEEGANPKALNIIRLLILTGCRRNEIAGLKWNEVNLNSAGLNLDETKTGKSKRPLSEPATHLLQKLYENRQPDSEYVFVGTKKIWTRVLKKSGIDHATLHSLRHTVASNAAGSGESLLLIGAILGHANARSTQRYAHIARDPALHAANRAVTPLGNALDL